MASVKRIFNIYNKLHESAAEIRDFQLAKGEKVSGTVQLLIKGDAGKLLQRWGEEMHEVCGVLAGTHDDPYILEATQTFYWSSLYAAVKGVDWSGIDFQQQRDLAPRSNLDSVDLLLPQVDRLVELGPERAEPRKLVLLWCVADLLYRGQTSPDQQRSLEEIMEVDLQDMKKRPYLAPVLEAVPEEA
jgi:phosphoribosyl-ATP pyrophosphohydrolase